MPIKVIQPRRLYQQIADQLRGLLDSGEFGPGDRLPAERELADQLGISRPTVREALIALEVEGRIRIKVGSGIFVTDASEQKKRKDGPIEGPFELLRARELVEGAVAEEAARQATSADIARLDDVLGRMERSLHPSPQTLRLDRDFHTSVAGILGNAVLVRFIGELFDERINPYFERLSSYFENPTTWEQALAEHRLVRDAIGAGNAAGAKHAMQHHLQLSQKRFSLNFGEPEELHIA